MMTKTGLIAALGCMTLASGVALAVPAASQDLAAKDARITSELRHSLTRDMPNSQYQMSIDTKGDGIVVLSGRTETVVTEAKAVQDAWKVRGVTAVENHLRIAS